MLLNRLTALSNSSPNLFLLSCLSASIFLTLGCEEKTKVTLDSEASAYTQKANQKLASFLELDQDLTQHPDYIDATTGLIAQEDSIHVLTEGERVLWSTEEYNFIKGDAPDTVNPSLWRQEILNNIHGLFKVADGIYQVRGYDLTNLTFIKGDTGWIIVDPLMTIETSSNALAFAEKHLGEIDIKAIIYTHSHGDHFGGVAGVVTEEEIKKNNIRIIAPLGFMEEATSENIVVGIAMARRSTYQYGQALERSPTGHVGTGLGKHPTFATFSLFEPNEIIDHTGQTLNIDGTEFIFQYTPDSEAPAELAFYLPEQKAYNGAEIVSRNMHNLYTLRGAKVRDALKWSGYIFEAREMFPETEVYFASHHWPMLGNERIMDFLSKQADTYKFIHDQSVRYINKGYGPEEIAETLELPESLAKSFSNRGYYGTLIHNAKAVYQHYMGWYDANPANLNPLPHKDTANRYVKLMGGSAQVISAGRDAYNKGDYRWAAELLNHLVFAEPNNKEARKLLAESYQQLAYQAESGPWRDAYLSGANELLNGFAKTPVSPKLAKKILEKTPLDYFLIAVASALDAKKAEGVELTLNLNFQDTNENFVVRIENSVFHHKKASMDNNADASIYLTKEAFIGLAVLKDVDPSKVLGGDVKVEGETLKALKFLSLLDPPNPEFNIIEP